MHRIIMLCLTALIAACNQTPMPPPAPEQLALQTVNNKPLPMLLVDQIFEDPVQPYRYRVEITDGWFKLEGDRYEQSVGFFAKVDGNPNQRWRWNEFGTCTPNGDAFRCESGFIQNYVFSLKRQGNTLITEQEFKDPTLKGTYTFGQ